jgi:hypothetical protein
MRSGLGCHRCNIQLGAMLKNFYSNARTKRTQEELNLILAAHDRYATHRGGIRAQLASARRSIAIGIDFSGGQLQAARLDGADFP